jgi:hypothetical protein
MVLTPLKARAQTCQCPYIKPEMGMSGKCPTPQSSPSDGHFWMTADGCKWCISQKYGDIIPIGEDGGTIYCKPGLYHKLWEVPPEYLSPNL